MRVVDEWFEDEALVDAVYEAQGERHERSRTRGPTANAGGGGAAHAVSEARAQLELRNAGAGSAGQRGVSQFLPDRDGEGAGREDAGSLGTSDWCGHGARVARSDRGVGAATRGDPWAEDAGGHDGGGKQYPLSDRQRLVG